MRSNTCEKLIYIDGYAYSNGLLCVVIVYMVRVSENLMRVWGLIDVFFDMLTQVNE